MTMTKHDRYPGPPPFEDTPQDHNTFHGRSDEIGTITHQIIATRLIVLFGKSGLGKTSLLQAGLFPRLRNEGFLPIKVRLSSSISLLELVGKAAQAVSSNINIDYIPGERGNLWEFFKTAMFWQGDTLMVPVLVFDQFEEIFTLGDSTLRAAFSREIGPLVSGYPPEVLRDRAKSGTEGGRLSDIPPKVKIILSLREEYLGSLLELSPEIPRLFQDRIRLLPLAESQAKEAIQIPALLGSESVPLSEKIEFSSPPFEYDEKTLKEMIEFLKGRSDIIEPFQLQLLCQHVEKKILKKKMHPAGTALIKITPSDLGGHAAMNAILQRFYADAIADLPRRERRHARNLCEVGLLTTAGYRLMLEENQIRNEYNVSDDTLDYLVRKRILRKEPRLDSLFYEISHDTIAHSILQISPWRIPKKYKPARAVAGLALIALMCLGGWWLSRLDAERVRSDRARMEAEKLLAFLI